jgi:hypothetical protein
MKSEARRADINPWELINECRTFGSTIFVSANHGLTAVAIQ